MRALTTTLSVALLMAGVAAAQGHPEGSLEKEMLDFVNVATQSELEAAIRLGWVQTNFTQSLVEKEALDILVHRTGPDGAAGTSDDNPFDTLRELYDTTSLGPESMEGVERFVRLNSPLPNGSATLRFVNKHTTTKTLLYKKVKVNSKAATNIPLWRKAGPNHLLGDADDKWMAFILVFGETALYGFNGEAHVHSLDEVPGCDSATIQKVSDYSVLKGY